MGRRNPQATAGRIKKRVEQFVRKTKGKISIVKPHYRTYPKAIKQIDLKRGRDRGQEAAEIQEGRTRDFGKDFELDKDRLKLLEEANAEKNKLSEALACSLRKL